MDRTAAEALRGQKILVSRDTELFRDQLQLDAEGYIKVEPGTSITNIEGVFAAGDVRDPHYRQAVTAAASGCIAAIDCERFLLSRAN